MNKKIIDQISQLVAQCSVSSTNDNFDSGNQGVVELLANWLETMGFECQLQAIQSTTGKPKANLIATYGAVQTSGGLVFAGHTDTVPFNAELWQQNPFQLTERDAKLYALGATDMKSFFAVALAAIEQLLTTSGKPNKPITIIATADEECTMNGARALTSDLLPAPQYAIIGEPTELKPIRMHKGMMMNGIRVQGKSGHSSNPKLGINAMEIINQVMNALLSWRAQLQQQYQNPMFEIATPTMNFGCIHGGDNPNRICGHCYMEFDLRPIPGMDSQQLIEQVDQLLQSIAAKHQTEISLTPIIQAVPAFEQSCHSELVNYIEQISEPSGSVAFATEAPFMQGLGMETLVWGPGSIDQAHSPNEYIDYAQIDQATKLYANLINHLCYTS